MRRGDRLFAGTREFVIEPRPDGTVLFTHVEDVTGLLFPVFHAVMGGAIQRHHDDLNAALKDRAERSARRSCLGSRARIAAATLSSCTAPDPPRGQSPAS